MSIKVNMNYWVNYDTSIFGTSEEYLEKDIEHA